MPSGKPAGNPREGRAAHLKEKLDRLQEMLNLTRKVGVNPLAVGQEAAVAFRERTQAIVGEVHAIDAALKSCGPIESGSIGAEPEEGCRHLERRIQETVQRLARENADLMASIKAQQEAIGSKIARLRRHRDLLKDAGPANRHPEPTRVDTRA